MATYDGVDLGLVFYMNTSARPKARQINSLPRADGLEVLDHGSRGGSTVAEGVIVAPSPLALTAAEQAFRSLQVGGRPSTLVDTAGATWTGVILELFSPVGRAYQVPGLGASGRYGRAYQAQFLHIY